MTTRRAALLGALVSLFLVVGSACNACSEGGLEPDDDENGVDSGIGDVTGGDADTGTPPNDTGGGDAGEVEAPTIEAFTSCGAGGVSSGSGVRAVQCYGPIELSGAEASGGGVRWRAGAFRVISHGAK